MRDSDEKYKASSIISQLMNQLDTSLMKNAGDVSKAWYDTVKTIKSFNQEDTSRVQVGTQLADHSRVIDVKNEVLIVETDHPGRLQLLQIHKKYILEGLRRKVPDIPIKNITYKLK